MKKLGLFLLFLLQQTLQAQVFVAWSNSPGGVSVATDANNNVYTALWDYNPAGDITLTKRNATGTILWNATFDNTNNTRHEVATWVDTDTEGNIYVSGTIRSGYSNPVNANSLLMKFSPSGTLIWRRVYEADFDGSSTRKFVLDGNNNAYVLGLGMGPNGMVTKIKKFSPAGDPIWSYFDADGIGAPINIKLTADNHLLITSRFQTGSFNGYSKVNLDGNKIWSLVVPSLTVGDASGDAAGNAYVVHGATSGSSGCWLKKLSPTGSLIWEKNHAIAAFRVEVGNDQFPVICGFPNAGTAGAAFVKYNAAGTQLWENLDADGPQYGLLLHAQLRIDNTNAAYLAAGILTHMAVCKVNNDGTSAWTQTISGSSTANAFDFGTDNSVYVTGGTTAHITSTLPPPPPLVCGVPLNLRETAVTNSAATLRWKNMGAVEYSVQFRPLGGTWGTSVTTDTFLTKTNLLPYTTYQWRIRAKCGTAWTAYSSLRNFTTPQTGSTCTSPTELYFVAMTANAGIADWPAYAGATQYQIRRRVAGTSAWTTATTTNDQYLLSGLTANTTYQVQVRSRCGTTWFPFSPIYTVTTPWFLAEGADERAAGSEPIKDASNLQISPNPADYAAILKYPSAQAMDDVRVEVFDLSGKRMFSDLWQINGGENSFQIIVGDWKPGIYLVKVVKGMQIETQKLVVY